MVYFHPNLTLNTDFTDEIRRKQILYKKNRKNHKIIQSFIQYLRIFDKKPKTLPLHEKDRGYSLQPKEDPQGSKITFRGLRQFGSYIAEKISPRENYIVGKFDTSKTKNFCRRRHRQYTTDTPFDESYTIEIFRTDDDNNVPQDDLYSLAQKEQNLIHQCLNTLYYTVFLTCVTTKWFSFIHSTKSCREPFIQAKRQV